MPDPTPVLPVIDAAEAVARFGAQRRALSTDPAVSAAVRAILEDVAARGDAAVTAATLRFDGVDLPAGRLRVTPAELDAATARVPAALRGALALAHARIAAYHARQREESWFFRDGESLFGQLVQPLASAGLYVPGGEAPYVSTVLMTAVPAVLAGVPRVVLCSPPTADGDIHPAILYAARLSGVHEVYRVGGAQAVGALALGTPTIAPVDKITGPGNKYVAEAKRQVFGVVAIDMVAGPSDVLVYADAASDPRHVVADLFAQAEHNADAQAVLVTDARSLVDAVNSLLPGMLAAAPRRATIAASLAARGVAVLVSSPDEAYAVINAVAPEHLEVLAARPLEEVLARVRHAGAVFLGPWSPEPVGDYLAGPNHTLPTYGTARFSSPLGVYDFVKKTSLLAVSGADFRRLAPPAAILADAEGFAAHARSLTIRLEES